MKELWLPVIAGALIAVEIMTMQVRDDARRHAREAREDAARVARACRESGR